MKTILGVHKKVKNPQYIFFNYFLRSKTDPIKVETNLAGFVIGPLDWDLFWNYKTIGACE